ncbi:uncharacterized protein LOC111280085 [Durio zibethinus]|uniref:Uncharacterized protein LOC111280085 n=1 Tax=Durio zibethinus TaxID=66656 RepID=A0A6P5X3L2_DURZI|nr:uncharacterized protein LOC111280085 [Durio zibethinus]XP_022722978.1 uncharacterized protein LOC111280085 [Durio zibethinus]XP_022722980.1 uncharacterized protein LOC111280085 [Durio zibethinus]
MNVENENVDLVTDLGLALGYSNHKIQRILSNDLGAGANAASRIDVKVVATDPLSELVWSPQKGPSLKCTDCSFSDKKHSIVLGAGPSNVVLSPQQINKSARSSNDKPIDEENFNTSISTFHDMNTKVTNINNLDKSARDNDGIRLCHEKQTENDNTFQGTAGFLEEISTKRGESDDNLIEENDLGDSKGAYLYCRDNSQVAEIAEAMENNFRSSPDERKLNEAQIESLFNNPANEARDVGSGTQLSRMEMVLASEVQTHNECEACGPPEKNLISPGRKQDELTSLMEKKGKSKMKGDISSSHWPTEKLEATAENDLQAIGDACVATSKISGSESASEAEKNSQHPKEMSPEKMSTDEHSATHSSIRRYRRKGKEKALSDGDVKGIISKEEDDSHESVESCNSAGLFSTGKKRWGFEQQLMVGSKRVKKQSSESPCSSSFKKQDSSFMNWISNMMKGFLKSKDNAPSLALAVANPNQSHESPDKKLDTSHKNHEPGCRNIGFQSFFHSIYSPKTKVQGTITQNENYQTGLELTNKICDIDATPIAYHRENFNFHKVLLLSNEKLKEPISSGRAGPPTQPKISSKNFSPCKSSEDNSAENKNSCNLAVGVEKDRASFSSSLGKRKLMNTENNDSDPPSDGKTVHNIGYKSNLPGSLWITRFTPKSSSNLLNQDAGGAVGCSSDCMKLIPWSQDNVSFSSNFKILEARQQSDEEPLTISGKELQNCATEIEESIGFNKITVQNDQQSECKVSPILPSPRFNDSEVMTSLFARRLDALKHIMPSGVSDNTASSAITCFFCKRKGHHLQYCPERRDNEIEDLLRNMKSSNRLDELSCAGIRCFELDHWAVACPNTSSRGQNQSACRASLPNLNELQCYVRFEETNKLLDDNQEGIAARIVCDGIDIGKGPSTNYGFTVDKMRSKINASKKYVASSSKENELKENQITPWGDFINQQVSDMPKAIFDAVRMLRLSRTDILKWMDSQISLSHLEGFFLRLRLGKWEEGLGGTGYFVACITGAHRQGTPCNSKNSVSVKVGGIKCLVESKYISNHDFLLDELMAWWRATTRSGGKIPSEEELIMKVKEKRMLGF